MFKDSGEKILKNYPATWNILRQFHSALKKTEFKLKSPSLERSKMPPHLLFKYMLHVTCSTMLTITSSPAHVLTAGETAIIFRQLNTVWAHNGQD